MIIRDSFDWKCRSVNVKNANFDWTGTAMSPSLLLIPFRILGPTLLSPGDFGHYFLKEILADHRALTTFFRRFFGSLRTCKTYCNQISIWTWHNISLHPLVNIVLDHGSQTQPEKSLKPHFPFSYWDSYILYFRKL